MGEWCISIQMVHLSEYAKGGSVQLHSRLLSLDHSLLVLPPPLTPKDQIGTDIADIPKVVRPSGE